MFMKRPLADTPEDRDAKENIKQLLEFERYCRDNALWDEMKTCYAADSFVSVSWFQGNGHDFVDGSAAMTGYAPHKVHNTLIWVNGRRAVAVMMATLQIGCEVEDVKCEIDSDVRLVTAVTQEDDGQWYIKRFYCIYDKDALHSVVPTDAMTVDAEELARYRSSYACITYVNTRIGRPVSPDMLGRDRPEQIDALFAELDAWLNE